MKTALILAAVLFFASPAFAAETQAPDAFDHSLERLAAKDYQGAVEVLEKAEAEAGDDRLEKAAIWANRGIAHANLGETDLAIHYFRRSLEIEKRVPRLHLFLGRAYLVKGKNKEAVESMTEAMKMQALVADPKMLPVHEDLWRAYAALGRQRGYDRDLVDREIHHLEKALGERRGHGETEPGALKELKFLVAMRDSAETVEGKNDLPDDGIDPADKAASLVAARKRIAP